MNGETNPVPAYEWIFGIAMVIAVAIESIAWLRTVFFGWKAIANRREGVDLFRDAPLGNPVNILFRGELLTERGLAYRRKMVRSIVFFLATAIAGFVVAAVIGVLASLASR